MEQENQVTNGDMSKTDAQNFLHNLLRPGVALDTLMNEYNAPGSVELYEESCHKVVYTGPTYCADMVRGLVPDRNAKILDIGCGTGLVGLAIHKYGYRNIHAHDGSQAMLEYCKKLNCYTDYICCLVGDGQPLTVEDNSYDVLVCSGGTCQNHFPPNSQIEFARVLKPGGYFINVWRNVLMEIDLGKNWVAESQRLEKEGKWKMYGKLNFPKYNFYTDGIVDIYQAV